jgi:hypothetical protein
MARQTKTQQPKLDVRLHYGSISEMVAACDQPMKNAHNEGLRREYIEGRDKGRSWYGLPNVPAVKQAMTHGYKRGMELIQAAAEKLEARIPRAVGVNRAKRRGPMGDELDIHAVNRGAIDRAWSSSVRAVKRSSSFVRIYVDICGNSGIEADRLQWRGVAGMTLADVLQRAGYSVEIVAALAVRGYTREGFGQRCLITTVVKPARAHADVGLLSASLVLTGFFRVYGFASIVRAGDDVGLEVSSGLGHPIEAAEVVEPDARATQFVIPASVTSEASAENWVKQTIELLQLATLGKEGR